MSTANKKCHMCAEEIPVEATICPFCGTQLTSEPPPSATILQAAPQVVPPAGKPKRTGLVIGLVAGSLAILCVIVGIIWVVSQGGITELIPTLATPTRTPRPTSTPDYAATSQAGISSTLPSQEINVACGYFGYSPVYINDGQPVNLYWRWGAATDEYRQEYIDAASFSLLVDGQLMDISSADQDFEPCYGGPCITWRLPAITLENGEHKVEMTTKLEKQVTDGYDFDENGELDVYGPGEWTDTCMIAVDTFNDMNDWVDNFAGPIVTDIADNNRSTNFEDSFDDVSRSQADWIWITPGVSFSDGNIHFVADRTEERAGDPFPAVNFVMSYQFVPRVIGEETWMDLLFRGSETTWYDIGIRPNDGLWDIAIRREDGSYDVLAEGYINPIQIDQEVYVVVVVQGNLMGFFVDNEPAGYANNFELYTDWVDFSAYSSDYAVVDVEFVRFWDLNNLLP
ncbi:MAG: hypothetical protein AB1531_03355 [Chloroflexota bacterium]